MALTGTEAIANGVPAFKPPESRNAANTMVVMAVLLAILFIGITRHRRRLPASCRPRRAAAGPRSSRSSPRRSSASDNPLYYVFQVATALILFLAANTSYNAFPRLAALLARDGYMPRQFSFRGDRLAFSWGIVLLSVVAGALIVAFGGVTTYLIPLYSVGVFVCFTLSQSGMVLHWLRHKEPGWWWRLSINALGTVMTAVVLVRGRDGQVHGGRLPRRDPDPGPGGDDAVHQPPVRGVPAPPRDRARLRGAAAGPPGAGDRARSRRSTGPSCGQ